MVVLRFLSRSLLNGEKKITEIGPRWLKLLPKLKRSAFFMRRGVLVVLFTLTSTDQLKSSGSIGRSDKEEQWDFWCFLTLCDVIYY